MQWTFVQYDFARRPPSVERSARLRRGASKRLAPCQCTDSWGVAVSASPAKGSRNFAPMDPSINHWHRLYAFSQLVVVCLAQGCGTTQRKAPSGSRDTEHHGMRIRFCAMLSHTRNASYSQRLSRPASRCACLENTHWTPNSLTPVSWNVATCSKRRKLRSHWLQISFINLVLEELARLVIQPVGTVAVELRNRIWSLKNHYEYKRRCLSSYLSTPGHLSSRHCRQLCKWA